MSTSATSPGRHFANLTSLGLSVQVAEHVPHPLKRILGRAAYPLTALALLPRHRPFTARLRVTDGTGNDGDDGTTVDHSTDGHRRYGPRGARAGHPSAQHRQRRPPRRPGNRPRHRPGRPTTGDLPARRRPPLRLTLATVRQTVTGPHRRLAHTPFLTARQPGYTPPRPWTSRPTRYG